MLSSNLAYFNCSTHNEPLTLVCIFPSCEKKGLICEHCQYYQHKHKVHPLPILFKQIQSDQISIASSLPEIAKIDHIFQQLNQQCEQIQKQEDRILLLEVLHNYSAFHLSSISQRDKMIKKLASKTVKTSQELSHFLISYNFITQQKQQTQSNYQFQIKRTIQQLAETLKQLKQSINNALPIQKITYLLSTDFQHTKYTFAQDKMHSEITITDKNKAEIKQGYSYRLALIDPPIHKQKIKLKKKTCTFKILKCTSLVGIGIVYLEKAKKANFTFSVFAQHGCYMISNSGYTYNQVNPLQNSQLKSWTFLQNQIIKVTIEPKNKKVLFQKDGKDLFQMEFQDRQDMELNFGVLLCNIGDSVEIM